jgi:hypothetical protein
MNDPIPEVLISILITPDGRRGRRGLVRSPDQTLSKRFLQYGEVILSFTVGLFRTQALACSGLSVAALSFREYDAVLVRSDPISQCSKPVIN